MSDAKIRLKPELTFSPAPSSSDFDYVVEDRVEHKFWKIGAIEHEVCSVMDGSMSVAETLQFLAATSNEFHGPNIEKAQRIIQWLMQVGMIQFLEEGSQEPVIPNGSTPPKASKLFDPSAIRIPLVSSETLHQWTNSWTWLLSTPVLLVAIVLWCVAIGATVQNNQALWGLGSKLFVPGSQWWWLLAWAVLKCVHEAGHAIACTRVGAKSNGGGVNFYFFAPMPYVDVTNLWRIDSKWSRTLVSAAGMLFELTFAAIAILGACWLENANLRYMCFTIATLGTFTTIAFNANPLMRYDGYYILIDLIGRPNLWQDASRNLKQLMSELIFKSQSSHTWSLMLLLYGLAAWCSRMLMLITMGWGIWMTWDGAGLVVVGFFVALWYIIPPILRWQTATTKQSRTWREAIAALSIAICPYKLARCSVVAVGLGCCSLLPSPIQIYWPAIVDYVEPSELRTQVSGFVEEIMVHDGQGIQAGDAILRMANPTLEIEYLAARNALRTSNEKCDSLRTSKKHAELQAEEALNRSLQVQVSSLKGKIESLVLKAPRDGILLCRTSHNLPGSFLQEGQAVGIVVDPNQIEVRATVPQSAWEKVAHAQDNQMAIYLQDGTKLSGELLETLPRTSDVLEWPSLGGIYGGPIAVVVSKNEKGEEQLKTDSPRLQARIRFGDKLSYLPPPGMTCSVKLKSDSETIWQTAKRWIQAALESHFQVATTTG